MYVAVIKDMQIKIVAADGSGKPARIIIHEDYIPTFKFQ
jgi:hypothetical protein